MHNVLLKYLPSAERDLDWGLAVSDVGFQHVGPNDNYPPQDHPSAYIFQPEKGRVLDEYQLVYITKGEGEFRSANGGTHSVHAGDVMLLFPGETHSYQPTKGVGWDEYWIGFHGTNIDVRVAKGFFNVSKPIFHVGISDEIVHTYKVAIDSAQQMKSGYQQLLAGCVNMLLGHIYTLDGLSKDDDRAIQMVQRAIIYINEHYQEDLHPEDVAVVLNIGYSRFRKIFADYTGLSPYQYILKKRIKRSKELMLRPDKTLSEIAFEVGFSSPFYFSTAFKRETNISPKKFRMNTK